MLRLEVGSSSKNTRFEVASSLKYTRLEVGSSYMLRLKLDPLPMLRLEVGSSSKYIRFDEVSKYVRFEPGSRSSTIVMRLEESSSTIFFLGVGSLSKFSMVYKRGIHYL